MADYAIHDTTLIGTSNIIRKKEGSSALIDPADYPKRINLMGMLQEKLSLGYIAIVNDGADDVPTRSLKITLPASLDGYSSVDVVQSGKNLFDKENPNEVDGYFTTTGFNTGNANAKTIYLPIVGGATYTVSKNAGQRFQIATAEVIPSNGATFTGRQYDNTATSLTITASANDKYLWAWIFLDGTDSGTLAEMLESVMIEVGSTASAYTPYTAPTTHTASLGRTVHGGSADIVNGDGDETHFSFVGTDLQTIGISSTTSDVIVFQAYFSMNGLPNGVNGSIISNNFDTAIPSGQARRMVLSSNILYFVIAKSELVSEDVAGCKQWFIDNPTSFVYELTTPTDFTFTGQEVPTRLGYNAFYSDSGDTEVIYRSSGTMTPILPTLISKTITANGTYMASDDDVDGYDEVTVNVPSPEPTVTPLNSPNAFTTTSGISGTDVERTVRTETAPSDGKYVFASDSTCRTNTGSGDGFIDIQKNGVSVVKQYMDANTTTNITIPDISVEAGDEVDIVVGFDNAHSSCNFQLYTGIAFVSEASAPSLLMGSPAPVPTGNELRDELDELSDGLSEELESETEGSISEEVEE